MQLKGTFENVDFEDVLEWLETAERTGALELENDRFRKALYFVSGAIVGVSSSEPSDSLAEQIAEHGLLSPPQLNAAIHIQRRTGRALVDVLHKTGAVADSDLEGAIERQAAEAVLSIFLWEGGSFCFREDELPSDLAAAVSIQASELVALGRARAERARSIRMHLQAPTARLRRIVDAQEIAIGSPLEEHVLHELEQPQTVLALMLATRASEFAVLEVIDRLLAERALVVEIGALAPVAVGMAAAAADGGTISMSSPSAIEALAAEAPAGMAAAAQAPQAAMAAASAGAGAAAQSMSGRAGRAKSSAHARGSGGHGSGGHMEAQDSSVGILEATVPAPDTGDCAPGGGGNPDRAQELLHHARRQMELRSYDEALELFRRAERADPDDSRLRIIRKSAEAVYSETLYRSELPPDARPVRVLGPSELPVDISRAARALLERIDGSRPVRALVSETGQRELATLVLLRDLRRGGFIHLACADREA